MSIVKIVGIAMLGLICSAVLKEVKPSLAGIAATVTGVIIIVSLIDEFTGILDEYMRLAELANLDNAIIKTVIKIIGIGYIAEFAANVCEDFGSPSIAKKILFGGKICIMALALPIISGVIASVSSILQ